MIKNLFSSHRFLSLFQPYNTALVGVHHCLLVSPANEKPLTSSEGANQKTQIQDQQQVQNHVIKIRDQLRITCGDDSDCVPETFIITV